MMKKLFTLFLAFGFLCAFHAQGQDATVTIPHLTEPAGEILVPIEVDFTLQDVCAFQFEIEFDDAHLEFLGVEDKGIANGNWSISDPETTSPILITWLDITSTPADISGKLLDIKFDYSGTGSSDITFVLSNSAANDCIMAEEYDDVIFTSGSVSPAVSVPVKHISVILSFLLMGTLVFFYWRKAL